MKRIGGPAGFPSSITCRATPPPPITRMPLCSKVLQRGASPARTVWRSTPSSAAAVRRFCFFTAIRNRTSCGTKSRPASQSTSPSLPRICAATATATSRPATRRISFIQSVRPRSDQVAAMRSLGFERFSVAGHDRGGRVAHRMALDHPGVIERIAVLDIAPTREMFKPTSFEFAMAYYHWYFLAQPFDYPERLIGADPEYYVREKMRGWSRGLAEEIFPPEALPNTFAASKIRKRFTRAAKTIGRRRRSTSNTTMRTAARKSKRRSWRCGVRKASCSVLFDPIALWKQRANDVRGEALPSGHYLAEEVPEQTAERLLAFFRGRA